MFVKRKLKSFDGIEIVYDIKRISENFLIFLHGAGGDLSAWKNVRGFFHKKKF